MLNRMLKYEVEEEENEQDVWSTIIPHECE